MEKYKSQYKRQSIIRINVGQESAIKKKLNTNGSLNEIRTDQWIEYIYYILFHIVSELLDNVKNKDVIIDIYNEELEL